MPPRNPNSTERIIRGLLLKNNNAKLDDVFARLKELKIDRKPNSVKVFYYSVRADLRIEGLLSEEVEDIKEKIAEEAPIATPEYTPPAAAATPEEATRRIIAEYLFKKGLAHALKIASDCKLPIIKVAELLQHHWFETFKDDYRLTKAGREEGLVDFFS